MVNCWFANDVKEALLVVKNKCISLLWELDAIDNHSGYFHLYELLNDDVSLS